LNVSNRVLPPCFEVLLALMIVVKKLVFKMISTQAEIFDWNDNRGYRQNG